MDEFYARLAHYVRHAETGGTVVVTRWGKPVATLNPFAQSLQAPPVAADE
jgi:prevent-host-death family protein